MRYSVIFGLAVAAASLLSPLVATAQVGDVSSAMRYDATKPFGVVLEDLEDCDDCTQTVAAPFRLNFFGNPYDALCITTNGGVYPVPTTADDCSNDYDSSVKEFAEASEAPMIAALGADQDPSVEIDPRDGEPAFADSDGDGYRDDGFGAVDAIYYGTTTDEDGNDRAIVTWYRVPMYDDENDPSLYSTFQIVLTENPTPDPSAGWDFTIEYNYGTLQDNEDGYDVNNPGSGCSSGTVDCRWAVGWSDYDSVNAVAIAYEFFAEVPSSELIDGGSLALVSNSLNSPVLGRYIMQMVGGETVGFQPLGGSAPTSFAVTSLNLVAGTAEDTPLEPDVSSACEVTAGALPDGIIFLGGTCSVAGTPTSSSCDGVPYDFTVTASNSVGSVSQQYVGEVGPADGDGDGTCDSEDPFPEADTEESQVVAGESVGISTTPSSSASSCTITSFNGDAPHADPDQYIPIGRAIAFEFTGCVNGETVEVTLDFGRPIPAGSKLHKVDEVEWGDPLDNVSFASSTVTYSITDGGPLDADGQANGVIVDPVSVSIPARATAVPVFSLRGLSLLVLGVAFLGGIQLRRGRVYI
jgi:hypothetical protein